MRSSEGATATIEQVADIKTIEPVWRSLEDQSDRSFFLSWPWIGTWLEVYDLKPWLLTVVKQGKVIGLGLFVLAKETRRKIIHSRQLLLHATGDTERDAITIEYNTFLSAKGHEAEVWAAALNCLNSAKRPIWDELIIKGATETLEAQLEEQGKTPIRRAETGSAHVDLSGLRSEGVVSMEDYLTTLSKNSRSQIRRSIRLFEERGPVSLVHATTPTQAWDFLKESAPHHASRWAATDGAGAFDRDAYRAFHTALVKQHFDSGCLEVVKLVAGVTPFAWLYNFIDRGRVYFYLCAFDYESDNRLKPGLVAHTYCIAHHLEAGSKIYDFMGGDNRYKTTLGKEGPEILSIVIQKNRPQFILENAARALKNKLASQNQPES